MIANERQYGITKTAIERFEKALAQVDERAAERHPRLQQAMRAGMESQLEELRAQVAEYEALRDGRVRSLVVPLEGLPDALIAGRIACGLTQKDLAERVGVKPQQIQYYEQTRYAGASHHRIIAFCQALGLDVQVRVLLPVREEDVAGASLQRHALTPAVR